MQVGDLVRCRGGSVMGIVLAKNIIKAKYNGIGKGKTLAMEYLVKLITGNKATWYIQDSLELVNEASERGSEKRGSRKK